MQNSHGDSIKSENVVFTKEKIHESKLIENSTVLFTCGISWFILVDQDWKKHAKIDQM